MQPQISLALSNQDKPQTAAKAGVFGLPQSQPATHPFRLELKVLQEGEGKEESPSLADKKSSSAEIIFAEAAVDDGEKLEEIKDISGSYTSSSTSGIVASKNEQAATSTLKEHSTIAPATQCERPSEALPAADISKLVSTTGQPHLEALESSTASAITPIAFTPINNLESPTEETGKSLLGGKNTPMASGNPLPRAFPSLPASAQTHIATTPSKQITPEPIVKSSTSDDTKSTKEPMASLLVSKGNAKKVTGPRADNETANAIAQKSAASAASAVLVKTDTAENTTTSDALQGPLPKTDGVKTASQSTQAIGGVPAFLKDEAAMTKPTQGEQKEATPALAAQFFPKAGPTPAAKQGERVALTKTEGLADSDTVSSLDQPASSDAKPKASGRDIPARQIFQPVKSAENSPSERTSQASPDAKTVQPTRSAEVSAPTLKADLPQAPAFTPIAINSSVMEASTSTNQSTSIAQQVVSQDLEDVVEKLVAARVFARADKSTMALNHPDFGKVTVEFTGRADSSLGINMPDAPAELRQAVAQNFAQNSAGNNSASGGSRSDTPRGETAQNRFEQGSSGRSETSDGQSAESDSSRGSTGNNAREQARNSSQNPDQNSRQQSQLRKTTQSDGVQNFTTNGDSASQPARGAWA